LVEYIYLTAVERHRFLLGCSSLYCRKEATTYCLAFGCRAGRIRSVAFVDVLVGYWLIYSCIDTHRTSQDVTPVTVTPSLHARRRIRVICLLLWESTDGFRRTVVTGLDSSCQGLFVKLVYYVYMVWIVTG